jgi:hypothetical protein
MIEWSDNSEKYSNIIKGIKSYDSALELFFGPVYKKDIPKIIIPMYQILPFTISEGWHSFGELDKPTNSEAYVGFEKNQEKEMEIIHKVPKYYIKYRNMCFKTWTGRNKRNQFQKWLKRKFKGDK